MFINTHITDFVPNVLAYGSITYSVVSKRVIKNRHQPSRRMYDNVGGDRCR